jgi:O-antigen/teichoic acid export membrane protein
MGIVALALLVPGILELFLGCGIGVSNVYFSGTRRFAVPELVGNSVAFALLGTAVGLIVVAALLMAGVLGALVPHVPVPLILLALLAVPVGLLNGYFSAIIQGLQRVRTVSAIGALQALLATAGTVVLVLGLDLGLAGVLLAVIAAGVITLLVLGAVLRSEGARFTPSLKAPVANATLSFGLRGHLGNILQFFNYRLDLLILNAFAGPPAVGVYSVSVRFAELLWHLPNAVGFVIFPKAAATAPAVMNSFTPRVYRTTLAITAIGAMALALLARPTISFMYSDTFASAYVPLIILLPGVVALGGAKVLTNEIAGRGYPHYNSVNAGLALVVTILLDVMLIPRYGIRGAAAASSMAYVMVLATALLFYRRVSGSGIRHGALATAGSPLPTSPDVPLVRLS